MLFVLLFFVVVTTCNAFNAAHVVCAGLRCKTICEYDFGIVCSLRNIWTRFIWTLSTALLLLVFVFALCFCLRCCFDCTRVVVAAFCL